MTLRKIVLPPTPAPFVGADVHYITTQGKHLAAKIVHIYPATGLVNLCIFKDGTDYPQMTETFSVSAVKYADPKPNEEPYTWHWIELPPAPA